MPLVQRGVSIGGWLSVAWDPRRFLAPYAERFAEELVAHSRHGYPGRSSDPARTALASPQRNNAIGCYAGAPRSGNQAN